MRARINLGKIENRFVFKVCVKDLRPRKDMSIAFLQAFCGNVRRSEFVVVKSHLQLVTSCIRCRENNTLLPQ